MTDGERRTLAGRDHQIVMAGEDDAESEGALQLLQCFAHGGDRFRTTIHFVGNQVNDGFRIGVGLEAMTFGLELGAQFAKVLDDAVVNDRDLAVMCGCALRSVGRPCVAQRVCPMPVRPASGSMSRRFSRLRNLPSARRRSSAPASTVAIPR